MTEPQPGAPGTGVRQIEVDSEGAGTRLDQFLMRLLPGVPRSRVFRIVRKGEVRVNGKRAGPEHRLQERDIVRVPPVRIDPEPAPGQPARVPGKVIESVQAAIVSEDPRLLVVDKPAGIAVHGGSGLSFGVIETLRAMRPNEELELVHRLDRETSGCLLVARKRSALRTLHELMREGLVEKRYLTLVRGHWNLGHTKIDQPLRTDTRTGGERHVRVHSSGKEALSEFRPIQWFGNQATLLEVSLHTGRTHQIRVHAAHAGHPVAGDEKYGDEAFNAEMKAAGLHRMFLHAHSVSFEWPQGAHGGLFSASAPLPAELSAVIDFLSGPGVKTASRPHRWNSSESSSGERRKRPRTPRPAASQARASEAKPGSKIASAGGKRAGERKGGGDRARSGDRTQSGSRPDTRGGGRRGGRQRASRQGSR